MRADAGGSTFRRVAGSLDRIATSAWFAYGSIFLIQGKLLWGIWRYRDLSSGDTSDYFVAASRWAHSLQVRPLWSPLYSVLWGSTRWIVQDPYTSTILHRTVIALAATLVVLAVLRRLLTPGIAWALTVWWALLPVNYDPLYELHLFSLLPELGAVLIALTWRGLRMRAAVFGVFLAVALLLRNEIALPLLVWTAAWIGYEIRARRSGAGEPAAALLRAAAVPTAVVAALGVLSVARSPDHNAWAQFQAKQSLNLCQAYAFGYQQRHDDFTASPFLDCSQLMRRQFGRDQPSLAQAISANPGAMAEQVGWNIGLIPYGVQLMLFDGISGGENHDPDYVPVKAHSPLALLGSIAVVAFVISGLVLLWRERARWWQSWIRRRAWGWIALGSLGASVLPLLFLQRPRPEYLYGLSVFILSVVGLCAMAWVDRRQSLRRLRAGVPIAAVLLILLLPSHFTSGYETPLIGRPGRPLKTMVDRLYPLRDELRGPDVRLLATYSEPACNYVGEWDPCSSVLWTDIVPPNSTADVRPALAAHEVDFIYADETDLAQPWLRAAIAQAEAGGWHRITPTEPGADWILLARPGTS